MNNRNSTHWQFRPGLVFLNHGSFGATPTQVLKVQREFQDQLEADPIAFLAPERDLEPKLDAVRSCLANLVRADANRLAFVRNATDGVNAVLRSLPWAAGDQILITNHGYNACNNAARFVATQYGLEVIEASIPFPIQSPQQVVDAIEQSITTRTKLLLVDHVTSPTGLVFPIEKIIALAHLRNVRVLVDGAHAPGMLPLELDQLAPDYYTANHHKWLCAPKVSGFLYVDPQWQSEVRPTVISHAANRPRPARSRFLAEFDWTGTFDPTPLLALPAVIEFLNSLYLGGMVELMDTNRRNTIAARQMLLEGLSIQAPAPVEMLGSLASIPLCGSRFGMDRLIELKDRLYDEFSIELPVFPSISKESSSDFILRIAMQAYNDLGQIQQLVEALKVLFA